MTPVNDETLAETLRRAQATTPDDKSELDDLEDNEFDDLEDDEDFEDEDEDDEWDDEDEDDEGEDEGAV